MIRQQAESCAITKRTEKPQDIANVRLIMGNGLAQM